MTTVTFDMPPLLEHEKVHPGTPPTERTDDDDDDEDHNPTVSQRSAASALSHTTNTSNHSGSTSRLTAGSPHLRSNLTRQHKDRDPSSVYERVKLLGSGSMGSVSLVRKTSVGGSARYNAEARAAVESRYEECFTLPVVGGLFRWIFASRRTAALEVASKSTKLTSSDMFTSVNTINTAASTESSSGFNTTSSISKQLYAMKSIHYNLISDPTFVDELRNEIAVLKTLDHPHVVKVMETYDYQKEMFVVMEVCSGGDLYARDPYTEADAARITAAMLSAVSYMHRRGVIHRDLKFENVLFVNDSPKSEIKLIDFGLSKEIKEHEKLEEGAGTM